MKCVLFLQVGAGFLISVVAGFWAGESGAVSAGLAALAVVVPNAVFATVLWSFQKTLALALVFFVGEMTKILATAGLLVLLVWLYPVHWPSFLASLIVVLQVTILALWKR